MLACSPNGGGSDSSDSSNTSEGSSTAGLSCEDVRQTASQFLADNGSCTVAADCQYADKGCYEGPEAACVAVSHVADQAVSDEWATILQDLQEACTMGCGGNECGASVDCVDGQCMATFP